MKNDAVISVVIPVYNTGEFLENCIKSIVNQTYKSLEIILVDDGSVDNSPAICDKWAEKDRRIKVIHKQNGGASSARNAGLDLVTGDYISFIDGDDYIDLDMLQVMLEQINQYGADAASCGIVRENGNGYNEMWGSEDAEVELLDNEALLIRVAEAQGILPVSPCNKLFKKEVVGSIRFDARFKYAEDVLFNYFVAKNISKMVVQDVARYHYVSNMESASHREFDAYRFDEHRVMDIIFEDAIGNERLYNSCIKGDVLKAFRTVKEMMASGNETDKYKEIRSRIVSNKGLIFKSPIFARATKLKTAFIWLFPNTYKIFISLYGKKH